MSTAHVRRSQGIQMRDCWGNELPPREALFTAKEWLNDIDLSREDFALFGKHVANLWRAETGFVAAKITDSGKLRFAASGDAYTAVWQAWMDLAGLAEDADLESQQQAGEAALAKLREEGLSETWRQVSRWVQRAVEAQPAVIHMNISHVICQFTNAPMESRHNMRCSPLERLISTHYIMKTPVAR